MKSTLLTSASVDAKRSSWRKNRQFRKWAVTLALLWLLIFILPGKVGEPRWQNPYQFGLLLGLGGVFFCTGVFGLYRCYQGYGCLDLSIGLIGWSLAQFFVFTCHPAVQTILIGLCLGDIAVGSLLPPGTISKLMYDLWIQAKQEALGPE